MIRHPREEKLGKIHSAGGICRLKYLISEIDGLLRLQPISQCGCSLGKKLLLHMLLTSISLDLVHCQEGNPKRIIT